MGLFFLLLKPNDKAGDLVFALALLRGCFSSWFIVGMRFCPKLASPYARPRLDSANYNPEQ